MELDAIGEMMNISLGSSATAVSNMLDHRVDITTPTVSVVDVKEFDIGDIEPAVGVEIKYVTGLDGSNIMLLRMSDIKVIVDILLGTDTPLEEFVLDELTLSAVCEVMNQMMGAASTALSDFLGRVVNISTPETFDAVARRVRQDENLAGAIAGWPVTDTIKRAHDGIIESTQDRSCLWSAQTPQLFRAPLLREAYRQAAYHRLSVTDDASVVEAMGLSVALVSAQRINPKLTVPDDFAFIEAELGARSLRGVC